MMVTFDEMKEKMDKIYGDCFKSTFISTFVSGFFTATCSLPFDNAKTKIQKQKADPITKQLPYSSLMDCFQKSIAKEGITGLWTGLPTYYFRVAPHAMITLLAADTLKNLLGMKK